MKLWTSGEIEADVDDDYREVRKAVEAAVNRNLESIAIVEKAEKWAVIAIIRESDSPDYGEVVKRSSAGKVLEFRLKIPHDQFLNASKEQRISLMFDMLQRSIDLMHKLKVSPDVIEVLRNALMQAKQAIH